MSRRSDLTITLGVVMIVAGLASTCSLEADRKILTATLCKDVYCVAHIIEERLTQTDCDSIYTDSYLEAKVDPLLVQYPEYKLVSLECK